MIIHHMSDGTIRKSVEGVIIPRQMDKVYSLVHRKALKEKKQNDNSNTTGAIHEKQILDR